MTAAKDKTGQAYHFGGKKAKLMLERLKQIRAGKVNPFGGKKK